jgi:hypothetical protein
MLRLELDKVTATLQSFNPYTEKSGPDDVPAASLRISAALTPDVLAFFEPTLKSRLFNLDGPRDLADGLPVRDPHMVYPLKRDEEMVNAKVSIEYGVNKPVALDDVKIKDFHITPNEGGTVILAFTVLCKPDAEHQVPKLYKLQRQGITISVEPAELAEMQAA